MAGPQPEPAHLLPANRASRAGSPTCGRRRAPMLAGRAGRLGARKPGPSEEANLERGLTWGPGRSREQQGRRQLAAVSERLRAAQEASAASDRQAGPGAALDPRA